MPELDVEATDPLWSVIDQLMARRAERGLSQRALAERMDGFTVQSTVCNWETGRTTPQLVHLRRWAAALGYDVHLELRERRQS